MMPDRQLAMNSDIQPVRLSQLPELTEEFFGLVFRDNRLSYGGLWRGSDVARLQLDGPLEQLEDLFIDRETFGNIFSFRSPAGDQFPPRNWRETDPVIAQRITFTGNPLVSTLFALGEREQCLDLIEARYYAMKQAMTLVQRLAVLESESNLPLLRRG
jgi:hypothetical protein